MALPTSEIKFSDLNKELGKSLSNAINLNDSVVRGLEGNPADGISMSQLRGKAREYISSVATNQKNLNVYNTLVTQGWDKQSPAVFTINPGVYIWSDNITLPALTSGGPFPNGLTIVNKGYIMGKGGAGGGPAAAGESGGPAISITTNVIIDNTYASAYIGGGGGGGGSGGYGAYNYAGGGGGAGGGVGGDGFGSTTYAGGSGGAIGQVGANGVNGQSTIRAQQSYGGGAGGGGGYQRVGGGGGGRIFPGTSGAGGYEYAPVSAPTKYTYAGKGGASNLPGENSYLVNGGTSGYLSAGGGGGWGAAGGQGVVAGGAGGKAVETNGYTVTWVNNNTTRVYGSVSGSFLINSNQKELNLYNYLTTNTGWDGVSAASVAIGSSAYIWSDSTSVPGLTTGGPYPNGLSITNNGYIIGKGGEGGGKTSTTDTINVRGKPGGPALSISSKIFLINNGYIAGGGGGGSASGAGAGGGGGAGGGKGGGTFLTNINPSLSYDPTKGGDGGAPGSVGGQINGGVGGAASPPGIRGGGGGGGRILPGTGGTYQGNVSQNLFGGTGGGSGGGAGSWYTSFGGNKSDTGGIGGSANNPGGTGSNLNGGGASGGGGGWGAAGGSGLAAGGAGGAAVITNGNIFNISGDTSKIFGQIVGGAYTITANQKQLNLYDYLITNTAWDKISTAIVTIAPGVYIWSDDTSIPALTTGSSYPNGLTIINQGYIMGKGGKGGYGGATPTVGSVGGPAISLGSNCTIDNTYASAYIGGGGGGGGGAKYNGPGATGFGGNYTGGGGGAGGGAGGDSGGAGYPGGTGISYTGGAGGAVGASGSNGSGSPGLQNSISGSGGGGGRIFPGTQTQYHTLVNGDTPYPGKGGSAGGAGAFGPLLFENWDSISGGGGGGGYGAAGGTGNGAQNATQAGRGSAANNVGENGLKDGTINGTWAGGAGGKAVALNGNAVTWISSDITRVYGSVS